MTGSILLLALLATVPPPPAAPPPAPPAQPAPAACEADTECGAGQLCVLGVCRTPSTTRSCATDADCPGDEVCEAGQCQATAVAGCTTDAQCKGGRVCQQGACGAPTAAPAAGGPAPAAAVAPAPPPGAPTPAAATDLPPAAPADRPPSDGWALAGGIIGLSMAGVGAALGIGSEITREDQIPALPLGAAATVLFATSVPIAAAAAGSARRAAQVRGSLGLRISGWVTYGLTLSNAVVLLAMGAAEIEPWPGAISLTTVLGVTSSSLMAADAFVTHKQARAKMAAHGTAARLGFGLAPTALGRGASFSLSARF